MFKILIKDLNLYGYHGVNEEEKKNGQNFLFNITIYIKKESFAGDDDIGSTLNYSDVVELVKEINSRERFNLLEAFSQSLADEILKMSPMVEKVIVKIEKTYPPIKEELQSVGVEYILSRKEEKN